MAANPDLPIRAFLFGVGYLGLAEGFGGLVVKIASLSARSGAHPFAVAPITHGAIWIKDSIRQKCQILPCSETYRIAKNLLYSNHINPSWHEGPLPLSKVTWRSPITAI